MQSELKIGNEVIVKGFETVTGGINAGHLQIRTGVLSINSGVVTPVTFYTPFSTTCASVVATAISDAVYGATSTIAISSTITKTGFSISQYNSANAPLSIRYLAIGY